MNNSMVDQFVQGVVDRNPAEFEFHQAVSEFAESVIPFMAEHPNYRSEHIMERLAEPDRIVIFRVCWENDAGEICCNRAWRVQFNNAIGPYKGGLRFHPNVTQSVLKFLGFEQVFKNALTGLPIGGAKGGSNFDPKGRSSREVMRFCQSMMTELSRHIGEDIDVPAGDIGVGEREISYLFGQYKRLKNCFTGVLTGKGLAYGGSPIRMEATGYGLIYFVQNMLEAFGENITSARATVSGSGNVALFASEKLIESGAILLTLSDSGGSIFDPAGIDHEKLEWIKTLKLVHRGRIGEYVERYPEARYLEGAKPWSIACDLALPCATQNAIRMPWSRQEIDSRLRRIMSDIHAQCVEYGDGQQGPVDYVKGANIAGFVRVADAMIAYGIA